jgi:hypothetical protein
LDVLVEAACRYSWVSPQILVTATLAEPRGWERSVTEAIVDRQDAKAAAAMSALSPERSPGFAELVKRDRQGGASIAFRWRDRIAEAFDRAGVHRF